MVDLQEMAVEVAERLWGGSAEDGSEGDGRDITNIGIG